MMLEIYEMATETSDATGSSRSGDCDVCRKIPKKYLCSACRKTRFCSIQCYKVHKEECGSLGKDEDRPQKEPLESYQWAMEDINPQDRVPPENLHVLAESSELREMLQNPILRNVITTIDVSDDPSDTLKRAMQGLDFQKFAAKCLEIVEPDCSKMNEMGKERLGDFNEKAALEIFTERLRDLIPKD